MHGLRGSGFAVCHQQLRVHAQACGSCLNQFPHYCFKNLRLVPLKAVFFSAPRPAISAGCAATTSTPTASGVGLPPGIAATPARRPAWFALLAARHGEAGVFLLTPERISSWNRRFESRPEGVGGGGRGAGGGGWSWRFFELGEKSQAQEPEGPKAQRPGEESDVFFFSWLWVVFFFF